MLNCHPVIYFRALKDHRERKVQLDNKERGGRKDTEGSLAFTVCQERLYAQYLKTSRSLHTYYATVSLMLNHLCYL